MGRQAGLLFEVDEIDVSAVLHVALCPVNALTLEGLLAIVDEPICTHREHCIPACPVHALSLVREGRGPCLWGACMISLVILGDSLASPSAANHAKDLNPEIQIQIITERAEIGLVEETPGLLPSWPPCPRTGYPKCGRRPQNPLLRLFAGPGF